MQIQRDLLASYDAVFIFDNVAKEKDRYIDDLLSCALGHRCKDVVVRRMPKNDAISIAVRYNPENAFVLVDKGPLNTDAEEQKKNFRVIWGEKAEVRRFKDGAIRESVVWQDIERHRIVEHAITYLIKLHYGTLSTTLLWSSASIFDFALNFENMGIKETTTTTTLMNNNGRINEWFGIVSNALRSIPNVSSSNAKFKSVCLPLAITRCLALYPATYFADPYPASPSNPVQTKSFMPPYCPIHRFLIECEGTSTITEENPQQEESTEERFSWPSSWPALQAAKTKYLLILSELFRDPRASWKKDILENTYQLLEGSKTKKVLFQASVGQDDLEPFVDLAILSPTLKYLVVFRAYIHIPRLDISAAGLEVPDLLRYQHRHVETPQLAIRFRSLHEENIIFGPACRLIKRWVSSQMLPLPDLFIERLLADLFEENKEVYGPLSICRVFCMWLKMVSTLKSEKLEKSVLSRLRVLCRVCLDFINMAQDEVASDISDLFNPNLGDYDALLYLHPMLISRRWQRLDLQGKKNNPSSILYNPPSMTKSKLFKYITRHCAQPHQLPLLYHLPEFDPIECFIHDCKTIYGSVIQLFWDQYGGQVIGIRFHSNQLEDKASMEHVLKGIEELGGGLLQRIVHQY